MSISVEASTSTGPYTRANAPARWPALDAFRGLAVIGMLLVNNPGSEDAAVGPLRHSAWNGCTIADLVFPFFLFVVGITTTISLRSMERRGETAGISARIRRRAALIFGIGILLNWFPFYQSGHIVWAEHPSFFDRLLERLLVLRIPGVLQRIAVAYLLAALIARRASSRLIALITAAFLLGYWLLLAIAPVPGEGVRGALVLAEPSRTIVAHVDRALFDWTRWGLGNHLWDGARTWDPEGVLSTIPAIATVLLGVLCGRWMIAQHAERARRLFAAGIASAVLGWCWSSVFPFNKALWTSSFVLFTAGLGAMILAAFSTVLTRRPEARWARPLIIFGENPLAAYVGSEFARRILHSSIKLRFDGTRLGTDEWVSRVFERGGFAPSAASLTWTLIFLCSWSIVLSRLSRRRLVLKV